MKSAEAAWLAALIDGEGCIYTRSQTKGPSVQITNTSLLLLRRVKSLLGFGNIRRNGYPTGTCKQAWRWEAGAKKDVGKLLSYIQRFLVVKYDKALLATHIIKGGRWYELGMGCSGRRDNHVSDNLHGPKHLVGNLRSCSSKVLDMPSDIRRRHTPYSRGVRSRSLCGAADGTGEPPT